jgi:hypothetical protein
VFPAYSTHASIAAARAGFVAEGYREAADEPEVATAFGAFRWYCVSRRKGDESVSARQIRRRAVIRERAFRVGSFRVRESSFARGVSRRKRVGVEPTGRGGAWRVDAP